MNMSEWLEGLRKVDLSELDLNNLGSWPAAVKAIAGVLVAVLIFALGYFFFIQDLETQLESAQNSEVTLKEQFSNKAFQAANLEPYKKQMEEMENTFGALLRQLPSDTEVPGLLEDITRTGLGSGLEFEEIAAARGGPAVLHRAADTDHGSRWLSRPGNLRQRCRQPAAHRHAA